MIVDTPPVLAVTDAVVLAPLAAGVAFVIGSEMTPQRHVARALETLMTGQPHAAGRRAEPRGPRAQQVLLLPLLRLRAHELLLRRPRRPDGRFQAGFWIAGLAVAWSTLAAGGVYLWAGIPVVVLALALTALVRPRVAGRRDTRVLDLTLVAAIAAAGLQVLPLPNRLRWLLSPRIDVDRFTLLLMPEAASTWRPLSLDPSATALAVALVAASALVFWSSRQLSGRGRALGLVHVVAAVGLAGAVAAILQRGVDPTRIYGLWLPMDAGARPFGPFVNRNHFATWLLMALPLTAGAAAAMGPRRRAPSLAASVAAGVAAGVHAFGSRRGWTLVALGTMLVALVLSFSRSALAGGTAALVVWCLLGYQRATRRGLLAAMAVAVVLAAAVVWTAPVQPILARVRETLSLGAADGRRSGGRTDRGADVSDDRDRARHFERSMLMYQTTDRRTRTNQAHSQYLQLLAEGGALVTVPCGVVCLAFLWLAGRRLREDHSPAAWLRIGGLAGLTGVAVQGLWETGLRMPANGILLAVVAAIAVHRPTRPPAAPQLR